MSKPEDKPKVHEVIFSVEGCSDRLPSGRKRHGHYIVVDGTLILTCPKGETAEDAEGRQYTHQLGQNDNPDDIAIQLTQKLTAALRGDRPAGFGRGTPLTYPRDRGYF